MSPGPLRWGGPLGRFSRVSGDEPVIARADDDGRAFSPRERG